MFFGGKSIGKCIIIRGDIMWRKYIIRNDNTISIHYLNNPICVSKFIRCIRDCIKLKYKTIKVLIKCDIAFPNACLPIAGIIQYYRDNYNIDFIFSIPRGHYLSSCGFVTPYILTVDEIKSEKHPFDKIICYNDSMQISELTQSYINAISQSSECANGVIDSLIWCLNEVMDNTLVHSESNYGYILVQYHPKFEHIAICIFDYGIGIYNSLKHSKHSPRTNLDAISLSIQEGIGDGKGQGNGLYGLYQIIENNEGILNITSGDSSIYYKSNTELKKYNKLPVIDKNHFGTIVDFQMNLSKDVDLTKVFKSIGGFDGFDIRLDNMLEGNGYVYDVYENCSGTATREAGAKTRNDVLNIAIRKKSTVYIDFSKVHNVSSSFIDEFIAKLVVRVGFYRFSNMFRLVSMNQTIEHLCNRAVSMRIHGEWVGSFLDDLIDKSL